MLAALLKLAGAQSMLLSIAFLTKARKAEAFSLVGLFSMFVAVLCFFQSFDSLDFYLQYPHLIRADWGLLLLLWPLIFLATRATLNATRVSSYDAIHFLPYLVNFTVLAPFYFQDAESKIQILNYYTPFFTMGFDSYAIYYKAMSVVVAVQSIFYSHHIIVTVFNYNSNWYQWFAKSKPVHPKWLLVIAVGMCLLSICYMMLLILNVGTGYIDQDYHHFFYLGLFVLIVVLSYSMIGQSAIQSIPENQEVNVSVLRPPSIPDETLGELAKSLRHLLEIKKIHRNQDVSALEVARELEINRQTLSILLRKKFNANFHDLINQQRVLDFKFSINDPQFQHLTLLGLAMECGFSSKSSFNAIFKKMEGVTPSQFAKTLKK